MPLTSLTSETFWLYTCNRYARGKTQELALTLQNTYGVNVNLLLFLCWCTENNVVVTLSQFTSLANAIEQSEQKLVAHRTKRQQMHPNQGGDSTNYAALKAQELGLEREQQGIIVTTANSLGLHVLPSQVGQSQSSVFNASIASFVNLYGLREQKVARSLISQVLCQ